jgi:8-oxo-dGTP pyrophosphatase MutT (NUDIX family)
MSALLRYADVLGHAGFSAFKEGKARWMLKTADGTVSICEDWECVSPFGSVRSAVVVNADGSPSFDRPVYYEAPNVNIVAWGRDKSGVTKIAIIRQPRPHADDPRQPGVDGHAPVVFGQIPMGFKERVFGKDMTERYEASVDAARRETTEETGASVILSILVPDVPWHNPNPTFVATWSDLLFVEVDLAMVEELKKDRNEPIFSAEFIPVRTLLLRISNGVDGEGALYRSATSNSAWMIFFATYPELFKA